MRALTVGTTATLISPAGNRDFLSIFNGDSAAIYLCFDGGDLVSTPPFVTTLTTGFSSGATVTSFTPASLLGICVGASISGAGIPVNTLTVVTSINLASGVVTCTPFTASANSSDNYSFGGVALTTSNGFPVPAGTALSFNNDNIRNLWHHNIYAISAAGTAAGSVRIQGI